jgi:hypothetical protein
MPKILGKLSKTNAAYEVLKKFKRPMSYKEIIKYAVENKLIVTNGKTPEATLRVDVVLENKRRHNSNKPIRFKIINSKTISIL